MMYLVENVNFNAEAGSGEKFEIAKLNKPTALKQTEVFKCILCKDEPSFASRKGLALHVEIAHAHSRETTSDFLKKNIGLTFKEVVESSHEETPGPDELCSNESTSLKRSHTDVVIPDVSIVKKK